MYISFVVLEPKFTNVLFPFPERMERFMHKSILASDFVMSPGCQITQTVKELV